MKSLLLQDFTKYDNRKIEAFLHHHKLFNIHAIVEPDAFTDQWLKLINRFAINVIIPIHCVEEGHNGLVEIEKRNPGFEQRLLNAPASKVNILRQSTLESGSRSIIALALSFPLVPIWVTRDPEQPCQYYDDQRVVSVFSEQDTPLPNVVWRFDLRSDFYSVSYDTLLKAGMVGDKECLVLM